MGASGKESGFTVVEMIVALVVLTIFLTLFFQLYMTGESQRVAVVRRAVANDIAGTNLNKITLKSLIPSSTAVCDNTTVGSGNPNNLTLNSSATGSVIATNDTSGVTTPTWATAGMAAETTSNTSLPSDTVQKLVVLYPRGCAIAMPAQIISSVTYGSETVSRATYVN